MEGAVFSVMESQFHILVQKSGSNHGPGASYFSAFYETNHFPFHAPKDFCLLFVAPKQSESLLAEH